MSPGNFSTRAFTLIELLVVMEANPQKFPQVNTAGARALADWLTGDAGQKFLLAYGKENPGGIPLFYPIRVPGEETEAEEK